MARYIDAEIAEKNIKETILGASEFAVDIRNAALECIRRTPAADVKKVVRGKWIHQQYIDEPVICSVCGRCPAELAFNNGFADEEYKFCPSCGAEMGVE